MSRVVVAEVLELHGDAEVGALEQCDHRLQVVALLAVDPDRVALGLAGDALRALLLDQPVDLAGLVRRDADLDGGDLAHGVLGRLLDVAVVEALERHAALDELLLEHLAQRRRGGPR